MVASISLAKLGTAQPQLVFSFIRENKYSQPHSCLRENGCLQILPGSHKMGRLDHQRKGDLASVDKERLEEVMKVLGKPVMAETRLGDALFFHSNLLHTSGPNISPDKRWNLVLAFNQAGTLCFCCCCCCSVSTILTSWGRAEPSSGKLEFSINRHRLSICRTLYFCFIFFIYEIIFVFEVVFILEFVFIFEVVYIFKVSLFFR